MNYISMLIPPCVMLLLFVSMKRSLKVFAGAEGFLLALYFSTFVFSFLLIMMGFESPFEMSAYSMTVLAIMLLVYFYPVVSFGRRQELTWYPADDQSLLVILGWLLVIGGLFSIAYFFNASLAMLSGGIKESRDMIASGAGSRDVGGTAIGFIATGFSTFFGLNQLLAFFLMKRARNGETPERRVLFWMLIISSFSYPFLVFTFAGRDGVVYWVFSILFISLLYARITGENLLSRYKLSVCIAIIALTVPFAIITISRFGEEALYSIVSYLGQMPHYFNEEVLINRPLMGGARNFPVFFKFFSETEVDTREWFFYYEQAGTVGWVFPYFFGSLIKDFGVWLTVALILTFSVLGYTVFCRVKSGSEVFFDQLFFLYFYCQIGFMGVFYFRHYSFNNYIIASFLLYVILRMSRHYLKGVVRL